MSHDVGVELGDVGRAALEGGELGLEWRDSGSSGKARPTTDTTASWSASSLLPDA